MLAHANAVAAGNAQQFRYAPDQIILELVDFPIGKDKLPHHFDDLDSAFLIKLPLEHGREFEKDRRIPRHIGLQSRSARMSLHR